MKTTQKMKRLLERMAAIEQMERGTLCRMGGRPHHNHQTWQDGKNVVRYVQRDDVKPLREAIKGYAQFTKIAEQYADEVIKWTRRERQKARQDARTNKKKTRRRNSKEK